MNTHIDKRIGENIRNLRQQAGISAQAMAIQLQLKGCDVTSNTIMKIETGQRRLNVAEAVLIKQILKSNYDDIFRLD